MTKSNIEPLDLFPAEPTILDQALHILKSIGVPDKKITENAGYVLLAMCGLKNDSRWSTSTRESLGLTKGIMAFIVAEFPKEYAPNTRETIRKEVLKIFEQARIIDKNPDAPDLPINSPKTHYALSAEMLNVVKAYGSAEWDSALKGFLDNFGMLKTAYAKKRADVRLSVSLFDDTKLSLSPGKHNALQIAIIEQFAPIFITDPKLLYLGDTERKTLHLDKEGLSDIGVRIDGDTKLPDLVILDQEKNWLFLIEAVTSRGPVSAMRFKEFEIFLASCDVGSVYVSAFPDLATFRKFADDIAWETEVWIEEMPQHMIHFNGDRFLGPR